ncbi:hypothetical protein [Paenirhodobacter enshiensis]|uniref:hypothetical protein n=1 Tax=Paenirhodobacter enshiensis TaxID=1105367 RepID=UPI0035B3E073
MAVSIFFRVRPDNTASPAEVPSAKLFQPKKKRRHFPSGKHRHRSARKRRSGQTAPWMNFTNGAAAEILAEEMKKTEGYFATKA